MANQFIINLKPGIKIENLRDGAILVYDAKEQNFYTVTEDLFMSKVRLEMSSFKDECSKKVEEIENQFISLKKEMSSVVTTIKEANTKMIAMVEAIEKE